MAMVESRRLRSWQEADAFDPAGAWRIVVRYHALRLARSWWLATLLVVLGVYTVVSLGILSYSTAQGDGLPYDAGIVLASSYMAPALALALLVGSGLFAEDLRLRAPLFYFSRPIDRDQYVTAKAAFLAGLTGLAALGPLLIALLLYLAYGWAAAAPPEDAGARDAEEWRLSNLDTFGEAAAMAAVTLLGTALTLAFVCAGILAASAYTQRAWHAAVAFCAVLGAWSILAAFGSDLADESVYGLLTGPGGWATLLLEVPFEATHGLALDDFHGDVDPRTESYYAGWQGASVLAALLLALTSWFLLAMARNKVLAQEGDL